MRRLAEFCDRCDYHVHSIVSAHLNHVRLSVHWLDLLDSNREEGSSRRRSA